MYGYVRVCTGMHQSYVGTVCTGMYVRRYIGMSILNHRCRGSCLDYHNRDGNGLNNNSGSGHGKAAPARARGRQSEGGMHVRTYARKPGLRMDVPMDTPTHPH
jgi:hypothetical protein